MILLFTICFLATDLDSLYLGGEYEIIIENAPLILLDTTLSQDEIFEVSKLYAYSLTITGKKEAAIKIFQMLLNLRPKFTPDPIMVSPKITSVFNEAKNKKLLGMPITRSLVDTIYIKQKTPLTVIIPGVSQIQRNKKTKGYTILVAQALSLAGLGISHYNCNKSHDEYLAAQEPQTINEKYDTYNSWYKKRTIFISTSLLIWFYNLIDALYFQ